jgi:Rrf2 family transcriptional regulator, cysteine metabolism repressor
MKLTRASAYTLKALAHVARQKTTAPIPSHVMADAVRGIPGLFLLKCLLRATSAGLLRSVKGPNGGYVLARPAREISVLEIVEAVDGPIRGSAPPVGRGAAAALDRRLQEECDAAAVLVRERLAKVSLADLARAV